MEAVIREKSGISELQNRNALLLHICCASGLKAKLDVDRMETLETIFPIRDTFLKHEGG
jgi:hypothetical protein